ncbi:MAG: bifunctional phosphoribosylaminoimidazolecarboxamide formyltransferase/IMP cyclohydrolase [Ignavibacteria bacterium]|nr:bifunctional phosphoribosylaminoimidazolecarboxamide formyltransferase/IMP cyclohydrolase [Ignavibacteria bacterium]
MPQIRRALISVSDKRGLVEFAKGLQALGVEIVSTGGTASALREAGVAATLVSEVTGFPEILNGRVKTLHPRIHAGLLALADRKEHTEELREHGIQAIDMVVVNLYPFEQTVARNGIALDDALEQIDIGGPAMLRAAAKNIRHKAVIVDPDSYPGVLAEMKANGCAVSEETCYLLGQQVFRHTAGYDAAIAGYLDRKSPSGALPAAFGISVKKEADLRYGENPHQKGALYGKFGSVFQQLHGKELSFNNIVDLTAAARLVAEFDEPTAAIIKHTNPCGVGSASTPAGAYEKALATDSKSAFGGVVALNRPPDAEVASMINAIFTEIIVAPDFSEEALRLLRKKKDRRLVKITSDLRTLNEYDVRSVPGGVLVQEQDTRRVAEQDLTIVTKRKPAKDELRAMMYAWRVAKHVKSNAIVYAGPDRTLGIGAGQMSRVDSSSIAAKKAVEAGLSLAGSAAASDAFFPFADGLLEAVKAGSTAVIQPGGSVRDDEVIAAADEHGIAMAFTGIRHFKH